MPGHVVGAAATGGTAKPSQSTRSVHTGERLARYSTRLALVLYELHPLRAPFMCTNFTTAARSSPGMAESALSPRLGPRRGHLGLHEFKSCRVDRCGGGVVSFLQDGRLRLHDRRGVERAGPDNYPQVFRVDGAERDESRNLRLLARRPRDVRVHREGARKRVEEARVLESRHVYSCAFRPALLSLAGFCDAGPLWAGFRRGRPALTRAAPRFEMFDTSHGAAALVLASSAVNPPMYCTRRGWDLARENIKMIGCVHSHIRGRRRCARPPWAGPERSWW